MVLEAVSTKYLNLVSIVKLENVSLTWMTKASIFFDCYLEKNIHLFLDDPLEDHHGMCWKKRKGTKNEEVAPSFNPMWEMCFPQPREPKGPS